MAAASPDKILKQLSELWVSLGKENKSGNGAGVLRACTMTLIVLAEQDDDPAALGETLAALMPEHPARTIEVRLLGETSAELGARVYSQCWKPFSGRQQICSERIEITTSDAALKDLAPFAIALAAPDLPLVVWCRSARLVERKEFWDLGRMARKIILDSGQLGEPQAAIARVAKAIREGYLVGDLAWTRLTRWRETLAQIFENPRYLSLLPGISSVRITAPPERASAAMYFRAWIGRALQSVGAHPSIAIETGVSPSVVLSGEGLSVEQTAVNGPLVVTVNGLSRCTSLPQPTDYLTVREELGILRHDPVFEAVLP
jgi:glucose-6-phosphate dehydrogenase assembly protein OpcA